MRNKKIILGIDASNIKSGGGLTHLFEILKVANPQKYDFDKVIIWSSKKTLSYVGNYTWLIKHSVPELEKNFIYRIFWQWKTLARLATKSKCDILFSPGGSFLTDYRPIVTMSRNMLPFEWNELKRFGISTLTIRYLFLYLIQSTSYNKANGLIFLSDYAKKKVLANNWIKQKKYLKINHGVNSDLYLEPRFQKPIEEYNFEKPFQLLYVSIINLYKHQWNIVSAVHRLRSKGVPVSLTLIGPYYKPAYKRLNETINKLDPNNEYVKYLHEIPNKDLKIYYHSADAFVFASSCENLPNILLEAMASGLPICCSNRGPMPEVLKDSGVYFDPENINSITDSLNQLINSNRLRVKKSRLSYNYSLHYSWNKCSEKTFSFLRSNINLN